MVSRKLEAFSREMSEMVRMKREIRREQNIGFGVDVVFPLSDCLILEISRLLNLECF